MSCLPLSVSVFFFFFFPLPYPQSGKLFSRFRVPDGCDLVAAAALPVAFGTSHVALVHRAQLTSAQVPSQLQDTPLLNCSHKAFKNVFHYPML